MDEKCALIEHKEINAVSYCEECKVYMCNECSNFHSKLCYYHHWYNICSYTILPIFDIEKKPANLKVILLVLVVLIMILVFS